MGPLASETTLGPAYSVGPHPHQLATWTGRGSISSGIPRMSVEPGIRDLARPSRTHIGRRSHLQVQGEAIEIGAGGTPEARPDTPTTPSTRTPAPRPLRHGAPSPFPLARHHSHPHASHDYPGFGVARSRPIRPRIAANASRAGRHGARPESELSPVQSWARVVPEFGTSGMIGVNLEPADEPRKQRFTPRFTSLNRLPRNG